MAGDGDTLWAWQVQEPDGNWSIVGVMDPILNTHVALVSRTRQAIEARRGLAEYHSHITRQPLRLGRFDLGMVAE